MVDIYTENRECNKCGFKGPIHNGKTFNFLSAGKKTKHGQLIYRRQCKHCFKAVKKDYTDDNKSYLREIKEKGCCSHCGLKGWWKLDFHHVDDKNKDFTIGDRAGRVSRAKLDKEMEKCILVCKNCHADIHHHED